MPLFCIDRSPQIAALPRSPQRVARFAGIVGAGSMLALVSVMVAGGNGADGAANADTEPSMASLATSPPVSAVQLASVTPVATDASTTTTLPLVCTNSYTVVAGDFWVRIAERASLTTSELLAANRANKNTPLFPDQVICLPDGANVVVPTTQETVTAPTSTTQPKAAPVATTPVTTSRSSA